MAKFRIVKSETTNGKGETRSHYKIQKKFLFWFFDYGIKTHYYTYTDWNAGHRNMPTHMAHITKRIFQFNSEEMAKEYLQKIENPFWETYKGDLIGKVFDDNSWKDTYINYSYSGSWSGGHGYEFSNTLDGLKEMIDRRKTKTKISVSSQFNTK